MKRATAGVAQRERDMKLSPPSSPQSFIGHEAQAWARTPMRDWLKPLQPAGMGEADALPAK